MKNTKNLGLPIYDNPKSDLFKISDVNNAHTIIDETYETMKNAKDHVVEIDKNIPIKNADAEIVDARIGKSTLGEKIREIDSSLENNTKNIDNAIYFVTPEMFGYVHGEDSTEALNEAISYCRTNGAKLICKDVTLFSDIDFRRVKLEITGTLNLQSYICKLGNNSASPLAPDQYVHNVSQDTTDYQLKILGAKSQHITINKAPYLKFELSPLDTENSMAYSRFDFLHVNNILVGNSSPEDTGTLWFNENVINLRRCSSFKITGTYLHNNNIINGGTFEGNSTIELNSCVNNTFRDIRFEGKPSIIFGEKASHTYIFSSWISSYRGFAGTVINNGKDNKIIYTMIEPNFKHYNIDTLSHDDKHFICEYDEETKLLKTTTSKNIFTSPIMEFNSGITFYSSITGCDNSGRFGYYVYDENFNKLEDVEVNCCSVNGVGGMLPNISRPQTNGFKNYTAETLVCDDNRVKYIQFRLHTTSTLNYSSLDVWIRPGRVLSYA